jgi:hypothetical protein
MLVTQKDTITKITGIITPKSTDTLKNKLGGAFTILKSTHFNEGQWYGFLATVIPEAKYRIVIKDPSGSTQLREIRGYMQPRHLVPT